MRQHRVASDVQAEWWALDGEAAVKTAVSSPTPLQQPRQHQAKAEVHTLLSDTARILGLWELKPLDTLVLIVAVIIFFFSLLIDNHVTEVVLVVFLSVK